jgi:hypothetical protein
MRARLRWRMSNESQSKAIEKELYCALVECEEQYDIPVDVLREALTNVPPVLFLSDVESNELLDLDAQASLPRARQGRWEETENAKWGQLDKKERRSAQKLAAFLDSDRSFPKQRPAEIDTRLALYLIFRFEEILGKKFPFSRPTDGGSARGPAFRAVLYALLLAELKSGKQPNRNAAELASIIETTRTKQFDDLMRLQGFERTSLNAVQNGVSLALTVAMARKRTVDLRGTRGKKRSTY